jgi:hypothetical protein|tara:strand:+ start:223 stop:756 length:534 start_codon:yes stop_codon:yes gene_type:complete
VVEHWCSGRGGALLDIDAVTIYVTRDDCTPDRTLGTMRFGDGFVCHTLEDPMREGEKVYGDTAIPLGTYRVTITRSKRFNKMMPLLHNVPNFGGVRLHCGNNTDDTSGCILVGMDRNADADSDGLQLLSSRDAMNEVQPRIASALARGEEVWLDIVAPRVTTTATFRMATPDATGFS